MDDFGRSLVRRPVQLFSLAILMLIAFALSGCPALMVPSLAYEGYKSTHNSTTTTGTSSRRKGSTSQGSSDHSIE